ncbi:PREDICTED: MATH domain and coiled-coil domain-containing protein At3g58270-like [Tarenaya hassleriana]|uniref:MATH domain and coiled-coil domain-containing protein At3g58270-like n=1 Tax=Tarenaya hassleriana TaxID=28532 RepID=UPI00053C6BCD|nr:PREDICTED: MATH domain and coiled-coil domain-containing protein At3g58270-like [Tarenaya hassleriana]
MDSLLSLIKKLCLPLQELAEDDIIDVESRVTDLTDGGFKIDWLKKKVEEVNVRKKKEQRSEAMIPELEEELQNLKLRLSEVEAELQKERAEVFAARVPLKFDDVWFDVLIDFVLKLSFFKYDLIFDMLKDFNLQSSKLNRGSVG